MSMCAYCGKGNGVCFPCLGKLFPSALEAIRRDCPHNYDLLKRDHQTDAEPVALTSAGAIRSAVYTSHFDTLVCTLCGDKSETATECDCRG